MLFWKRKELWLGNSMEEFSRIRQVLAKNHIRCDIKLKNRMQTDFGRRTPASFQLGNNPLLDTMYYLYVDKDEYERAKYLIDSEKS
jgi:hypothetical protein